MKMESWLTSDVRLAVVFCKKNFRKKLKGIEMEFVTQKETGRSNTLSVSF